MPYASNAQRRFFHTDTAKSKGISASTVNEFDQASKGMALPDRTKAKPRAAHHAAMRGLHSAVRSK